MGSFYSDPFCRNRLPIIDPVFKGLAKGNLWLFYDISGWHWYYTRFRSSFDV
ncbi:DUF2515 family protein [Herbaspirillum aquaticum]|uniref:DUF2515 family protein n=1 Tax=Herbaspirillum aquaticum TaxID=568783 RepID=UPI003B98589A